MDVDFASSLLVVGGFVVLILCIGLQLLSVAYAPLSLRELKRNTSFLLARPFIDLNTCLISWLLIGWALANGRDIGLFLGTTEYATTNTKSYELWFYQFTLLYMSVTIFSNATISKQISGNARFICVLVYSSFVYPILYHWLWSAGGWLAPYRSSFKDELLIGWGVLDSAGSSLIQISSGIASLLLMWLVIPKSIDLLSSDGAHVVQKTKNKVKNKTSDVDSVEVDALLGTACDDNTDSLQGKDAKEHLSPEEDHALKIIKMDDLKTRKMYAYVTAPPLLWLGFLGLNVLTNLPENDSSIVGGKR